MPLGVNLKLDVDKARKYYRDSARRGLLQAARVVLNRANKKVPLDTGILLNSGQVQVTGGGSEPAAGRMTGVTREGVAKEVIAPALQTLPVREGDEAAVVFYNTPYAVYLHEHPELDFQGGREGKWLERAVNESQKDILKALTAELNR